MKKTLYIFVLLLAVYTSQAQNLDDALRFNKRELTGTSRSLGMANAFGALGGDLSAISINPAGIAVYRSSEFAFTPSISLNSTTAEFGQYSTKDDKYAFPFNQIGFVATNKPMREKESGIISTHFGFTYNRTADFNSNTAMMLRSGVTDVYDNNGHILQTNTLLNNILLEANGYYEKELTGRAQLAYKAYLLDPLFEGASEYYSQYEDIIDYDDGTSSIFNRNVNGVIQQNIIEQSGYAGEYGFSFGANVSNRLLIGASLNFHSFKFEQKESFREINDNSFVPQGPADVEYFDYYSKLNQKGFGVNVKTGLILNLHPLRLGASFHIPTFYSIDEEYYSGLESYFVDYSREHIKATTGEFSYNYRTPYKVQGSAAIVIGKHALLSFDYEMTDHTSAKINSKDGYNRHFDLLNEDIQEQFKTTHNFKAGVEIKPVPYIAIRGGAAYFDSPVKKEFVDVEPIKWMATAGLGIKNKNFFFDVAYALKLNESNYYIDTSEGSRLYGLSFNDPVDLSNRNHQVSFTFGWKF